MTPVFRGASAMSDMPEAPKLIHQPTQEDMEASRLAAFIREVERSRGMDFGELGPECYTRFHAWTVGRETEEHYLSDAWDFFGIVGEKGERVKERLASVPYTNFFPDSSLSYAENVLKPAMENRDRQVVAYRFQDHDSQYFTGQDLLDEVSRWEQVFKDQGIVEGDVIGIYMPYRFDYVPMMLAAANLGAPIVKAGTNMKVPEVASRFAQTKPKLLIASDGFPWKDKIVDASTTIAAIQGALDGNVQTLVLPHKNGVEADLTNIKGEDAYALKNAKTPGPIEFVKRDPNYPVLLLLSSGSSGAPKIFVHTALGTLLGHLSEQQLNSDIRPGDRSYYATTLKWMMSDWHVSMIANGATILMADGDPQYEQDGLFRFLDDERCTQFGTSATVVMEVLKKQGINIRDRIPLEHMRSILYTAAVLPPPGFRYLAECIRPGVPIMGISGGTDLVGCFVGGNPLTPTYEGQIHGPMLGKDIQVLDPTGRIITKAGEFGELACMNTPISRPQEVRNKDYRETYYPFDGDPPPWVHGDRMCRTSTGQLYIPGRSGETHNKLGQRIEPAEIRDQLTEDTFGEEANLILQSASVNFWDADNNNLIALFLVLDGLDKVPPEMATKIKDHLRNTLGREGEPDEVYAVSSIPLTPKNIPAVIPLADVLRGEEIDCDLYGGKQAVQPFIQFGEYLRNKYQGTEPAPEQANG